MLRAGRMDEFVTEEEEPWYDQRDLEQGEKDTEIPHSFDNKARYMRLTTHGQRE